MSSPAPARRYSGTMASSSETLLNKPHADSSLDEADRKDETYIDPESLEELPLAPGMSRTDNMLRWGFIRKVYGIISAQLLLTVITCSVVLFSPPVLQFTRTNVPFQLVFFLGPLLGLIPLYLYQRQHPLNLILLGAWTTMISVTVAVAVSFYPAKIVLEAVALTTSIVLGLTAYTFRAVKKGKDFSMMGPFLFSGLIALVMWSFIQVFVPVAPIVQSVFALLGAVLFSAYIVYDTESLIKRYDLDQYIWASVHLYLDIINLFLELMRLLNGGRN
ncbi:hypothetical protein WJX73_002355 [Symbiochloris irregularis]|uniref:Uncharacterized protein n=1 Tax=Symbiochloris irregularis TaxID=706552 RepID=A0AAW1PJF7_9CHLO